MSQLAARPVPGAGGIYFQFSDTERSDEVPLNVFVPVGMTLMRATVAEWGRYIAQLLADATAREESGTRFDRLKVEWVPQIFNVISAEERLMDAIYGETPATNEGASA